MKRKIEGRKKWRRGKKKEDGEKEEGRRSESRDERKEVEEGRRERRKKAEEKAEERKGGRREKIQYAYSWYKVATTHASIIKPLPLPNDSATSVS